MRLDPRTPVIVGVGRRTRRPGELTPEAAPEPAGLLLEALRRAELDASARGSLLQAADCFATVPTVSWRYPDLGAVIADLAGATARQTWATTVGGDGPQLLVNRVASAIARGAVRVAVLGGVETLWTRRRLRRSGATPPWPERTGAGPDVVLGHDRPGLHPAELAAGLSGPIDVYPLLETALRARRGEDVDAHQQRIAELWASMSQVAATNLHAWRPTAMTATEIATVTPANRWVGHPYTKLMCADMEVDMAAGLIMCSAEAARSAGVPDDRWIFPLAGADATDRWWVSERDELDTTPALRACASSVLGAVGRSGADVDAFDLYACFPSAVQLAADAFGLADADDLTLTGGLTFGGGPLSASAFGGLAAMIEWLRDRPGAVGVVTGMGWFATKHAAGAYGARPPQAGFQAFTPQADVDRTPARVLDVDHDGVALVEAHTVVHDGAGQPDHAVVALRTLDDRRAWARSREPAVMKQLCIDDLVGTVARRAPDGTLEL